MKKISSRSRLVPEMIRDRQTFETYGALSAERVSHGRHYGSGMLSAEREVFYATSDIDYIVWSYATPIAWHSESKGWYKVNERFSRTTSAHQGKLYLIGDGHDQRPYFTEDGTKPGHWAGGTEV